MKNHLSKFIFLLFLTIFFSCKQSNEFESAKNDEKFESVKIGEKIWMKKNLNVDKFKNGNKILLCTNPKEWEKNFEDKKPSYCYFNFETKDTYGYGKIYNFYAITDNLAPEGWRVANESDWNLLKNQYNNTYNSLMKPETWSEIKVLNPSGFDAVPGGFINDTAGNCNPSELCFRNNQAHWWCLSSELGNLNSVWLANNYLKIDEPGTDEMYDNIWHGSYVRCVKD